MASHSYLREGKAALITGARHELGAHADLTVQLDGCEVDGVPFEIGSFSGLNETIALLANDTVRKKLHSSNHRHPE